MKRKITARSTHEAGSPPTVQNDPNIGHWCLDLINNRLYWSDETHHIFGIPKERFLPYYSTFFNTIHPDDRAALTAHRDLFIQGAIPMNIEYRIILPSGEIRHVRESGERIFDLNNRLVWLTGTVQDIGGCRTVNRELQNLPPHARQTCNPVIVIDNNGYITWVNNSFVRTFGFELQEVVGKRPENFLQGPETDPGAIVYLHEKIQRKERFEVEVLKYSKSGQKYWMLVQGHPIFDRAGKCTGFFTINHHMTGNERLYFSIARHCSAVVDTLFAKSAVMASNVAATLRKLSKGQAAPAKQDLFLYSAIDTLIDEVTTGRPMTVCFDTEMFYEKGLTKKVKLNVFRVIQEQISNIVKFAYASEVTVSLRRTHEKIFLVIQDNGHGFDKYQKRNGFCITDIVECAEMNNGKATIKSEPGMGNLLNAEFPINFHGHRKSP